MAIIALIGLVMAFFMGMGIGHVLANEKRSRAVPCSASKIETIKCNCSESMDALREMLSNVEVCK
jgi:hypothetical protein